MWYLVIIRNNPSIKSPFFKTEGLSHKLGNFQSAVIGLGMCTCCGADTGGVYMDVKTAAQLIQLGRTKPLHHLAHRVTLKGDSPFDAWRLTG